MLQPLDCCSAYSVNAPQHTDPVASCSKMDVDSWWSLHHVFRTDSVGLFCNLGHRSSAVSGKPIGQIFFEYFAHWWRGVHAIF